MKLKFVAAFAIIASTPVVAFASPSCTTEPKANWMSADAMKAKIDALGYKVKTFEVTGNAVELAVSRLRKKLDGFPTNALIETVRGVGYMMREEDI